jgi:hypothetical protein
MGLALFGLLVVSIFATVASPAMAASPSFNSHKIVCWVTIGSAIVAFVFSPSYPVWAFEMWLLATGYGVLKSCSEQ